MNHRYFDMRILIRAHSVSTKLLISPIDLTMAFPMAVMEAEKSGWQILNFRPLSPNSSTRRVHQGNRAASQRSENLLFEDCFDRSG